MYQENGKLYYSKGEQCDSCANKNICPLLGAIIAEMVEILPDEFSILDCKMYQERKLKIIRKKD